MTEYTRREIKKMSPEIINEFRTLAARGDLPGYEAYLEQYPHLTEAEKQELIKDFMRFSANYLRRNWQSSK
jgi:hypothetical protein